MNRTLAILLASALVPALACCHRTPGPARDQAAAVPPTTAGCDTVFTSRYASAPADSGFDLVQVDASGDSLALYVQCVSGDNPHLRLWGPTLGLGRRTEKRLMRFHRLEILDRHTIFESATDVNTQGANSGISSLDVGTPEVARDGISWRQTWRYVKRTGTRDTLGVVRTVTLRCGDPYFLVRYDFTWLGAKPGSVRFIWSNHPRAGQEGSKHDVGFVPGYGLVTRQHVFAAADLGYFAAVADLGNPAAAKIDTMPAGGSSHMWPNLRVDAGGGDPEFLAGFVCFNPARAIVPSELAWMDSTGEGVPSLDYDSPRIAIDTTRVLDGGHRTLLARTPDVTFNPAETKTLEYAVGRATLAGGGLPVIFPAVTWLDGTKSGPPANPVGRRRSR